MIWLLHFASRWWKVVKQALSPNRPNRSRLIFTRGAPTDSGRIQHVPPGTGYRENARIRWRTLHERCWCQRFSDGLLGAAAPIINAEIKFDALAKDHIDNQS